MPGLPAPPDPSHLSGLERLSLPGESRGVDAGRDRASTPPSACSSSARSRSGRASRSPTRTRRPWPRSAPGSTACRWPSSWPRPGSSSCRPTRSSPGSSTSSTLLAAGARDLPERQQTLRGAIAWSYDLLDDGASRLLDRLSVFAGGFDLDAAEAICGPAARARRRRRRRPDRRSPTRASSGPSEVADGEPRFRLLDTIREFAAEQLAARGETATSSQARHRDWFVALAARAAPRAVRRRPAALARPARARARQHPGRPRPGGRRARPAGRDRPGVRDVALLAEARPPRRGATPARGDRPTRRGRATIRGSGRGSWRRSAASCWWQGEIGPMGVCYAEALELWRAIGDEAEIANALLQRVVPVRRRPRPLGVADRDADPRWHGRRLPREARDIFHRIGDQRGEANALWGLGNYRYFRRRPGHGIDEFRQALEIFREVGDRTMEAWSLHMLGTALLRTGDVGGGPDRISSTPSATSTPPATRRADPDPRRPVGGRRRPRATCRGPPGCAAPRGT